MYSLPNFCLRISFARSSTFKCFEIATSEIRKGFFISETVKGFSINLSRIFRRVGSERQWKILFKRRCESLTIRLNSIRMKIICQYSENRAAKYMIIDNGQFFVLLLFQMAKNAQKSNKFLLVLLVAVALAIPVTLALISNRTSLTQQATSYPDLNRVEEIVTTNNPDGTMGPPSWLNNFAQTLPAYQKGQLAFFVTDPPPSGAPNRRPTVTSLTLTISKVEVHLAYLGNPQDKTVASPSADRWETLNVPDPTTVDLVELAATKYLSSLGTTALADGQYTEVRL